MSQIERNQTDRRERFQRLHYTTMAAEGLPRLAFTVDDVYRMVEAGILLEEERLELIDGELVPMNAKGNHHEVLKFNLLQHLYRAVTGDVALIPETTFRLSDTTFLEPDIIFFSRGEGLPNLRGNTALLVIEIADSSLAYDLGRKAQLYARFGIQELWVIDAIKLITYVHREPAGDRYKLVEEKGSDEPLVPKLIHNLSVTLSALKLN